MQILTLSAALPGKERENFELFCDWEGIAAADRAKMIEDLFGADIRAEYERTRCQVYRFEDYGRDATPVTT